LCCFLLLRQKNASRPKVLLVEHESDVTYLVKNEFFAVVQYEGEKEATKVTGGTEKISSIFLKDYGKILLSGFGERNRPRFVIVEDYPVSFDTNYFYQKKFVIYCDGVQIINYEKIEKDGFEICKIEDQILFFI